MPSTYQCGACHVKWTEEQEPLDCPKCGSRIIEKSGRFGGSMEDHYRPPGSSIYTRPRVSSASFSITYWMGWAGLILGCIPVVIDSDETPGPLTVTGGLVILVSFCCWIAAHLIAMVKIYRAWDLIQSLREMDWAESDMLTPGMAVGVLWIPLWNLYWDFRAIHGLAIRANKYMALSGVNAPPMNEGMAQMYCILQICSIIPCISFFTGLANAVIYYLVVLEIDKMRGAVQGWQEGGQKPNLGDDFGTI